MCVKEILAKKDCQEGKRQAGKFCKNIKITLTYPRIYHR